MMQNLNSPLPIVPLNGTGTNAMKHTPLDQALAMGANALFQGNAQIKPIPQGGPFLLEIPLNQ
jgi:hypothetical protein